MGVISRLSLIILTTATLVQSASQYVRCFQRTERRAIDNSQPIVEIFYVSPHQCLDQCILSSNNAVKIGLCRAVVYDHFQHSCRLYDHSGNKVPAITHPAAGFDLYVRTATTQECGGPMLRFFRDSALTKRGPEDSLDSATKKVSKSPPDGSVVIHRELNGERVQEVLENPGDPFANRVNPVISTTSSTTSTTTEKPTEETTSDLENWTESAARQRDIELSSDSLSDSPKILSRPSKIVAVPNADFQTDDDIITEEEATRDDNARTTRGPELSESNDNQRSHEEEDLDSDSDGQVNVKRVKGVPEPLTPPPPGSAGREAIVNILAGQLNQFLGMDKILSSTAVPESNHKAHDQEIHVTQHPATPRPKQIVCPTSLGYYVVAGNEMVLPSAPQPGTVHVFEGVGQPMCGQLCSTNRGPSGESLQCASINYHHETKRCELYSVLAEPHGPGALLENSHVIYSEKFCLPAHHGKCLDDDIFILHAQKQVRGHIVLQVVAYSIAQCLQACLNTPHCRSATLVSTASRCLLTSDDVTANPMVLYPADAGTVVVENGCNGFNRAVYKPNVLVSSVVGPPPPPAVIAPPPQLPVANEGPWAEWSVCRYKVGGGTGLDVEPAVGDTEEASVVTEAATVELETSEVTEAAAVELEASAVTGAAAVDLEPSAEAGDAVDG
ncbi:unnamed protein product [Bursaphelenchus xylophilus]|uniref:(pine wood nematode) hypothetical protein n=1 Tax=Bursaphelenchus xylophilus TaxID=6326 RepID=A0A1I7S7L5_BURXY|nr:unnamed protein product [Bursaphelenchus xylophilus]CAG9111969.1 unnamed protein product [Bursaphelenchus xylophilus]